MGERKDRATDEFGWPWWWGKSVDLIGTLAGLFFFGALIWGTFRAIGLFWRPFD